MEVQLQNISHLGEELTLALEILFFLIKLKPKIKRIEIFDHKYLYSAYADDTIFLLKDIISLKHMVDTFSFFLTFQD